MTEAVKSGDTISVHYTGRLDGGEIFDTSEGKDPLKFTVGTGQLIKGFDAAVIEMLPGDKKTVTIPPTEGYGDVNPDATVELPVASVPEEMKLAAGMQIHLTDPDGRPVPALVLEVGEENIKMDLNHPLAGKTLIFEIEVVETGLTPDAQGCNCSSGSCETPEPGCGCSSGGSCDC